MTNMFTITKKIDEEAIADLLCSALEGGSNYWYCITDKIEPKKWTIDSRPISKTAAEARELENFHYMQYYPLNQGGGLMINDSMADDPELKTPVLLDREAVQKGLEVFAKSEDYKHHWADFINDNADGITADVFLQMCIFGSVIYG